MSGLNVCRVKMVYEIRDGRLMTYLGFGLKQLLIFGGQKNMIRFQIISRGG